MSNINKYGNITYSKLEVSFSDLFCLVSWEIDWISRKLSELDEYGNMQTVHRG